MSVFGWIMTLIPVTASIGLLIYMIRNYDRLRSADEREGGLDYGFPLAVGSEITTHKLAELESGIKDLVQVIIAAHEVERPTNALYTAVEKNFERGVRYRFLISASHAKSEVDGYYQIFRAIAHIVIRRTGSSFKIDDLVSINQLSFDWRDTPYIFYQAKAPQGKLATLSLRGNQKDEGIADKYTRLSPEIAHTIALALLSDAPNPLSITEDEFLRLPQVVDEEDAKHAEKEA